MKAYLKKRYRRIKYRLCLPMRPTTPTYRQVQYLGREMLMPMHEDVGWRMALFREFEPRELIALNTLVESGDIFIDIGANAGIYSTILGRTASKVYAIEPIALNASLTEFNALLNGQNNLNVICQAISDYSGIASFSVSADSGFSSLCHTGRSDMVRKELSIQCSTLDNMIVTHGIARVDIVKIDTEGAELKVLKGAETMFRTMPPKALLIELSETNQRAFSSCPQDVIRLLKGHGYTPYSIGYAGPVVPYPGHDALEDVLFLRERSEQDRANNRAALGRINSAYRTLPKAIFKTTRKLSLFP